jgi:hypothetical protein
VRDVWDGVNLKFTFRRTVDRESMYLYMSCCKLLVRLALMRKRMPLSGNITRLGDTLSNLCMLLLTIRE